MRKGHEPMKATKLIMLACIGLLSIVVPPVQAQNPW
jgi:hypothetical protein